MITILENKNWEPLVHHRLIEYAQYYGYTQFRDMILDICQKYYNKPQIFLGDKKKDKDILDYIVNELERKFRININEYDLCSICSPKNNVSQNQKRQLMYHRHSPGYLVPFSFNDFNHISFSFLNMYILVGNILKKYGNNRLDNIKNGESYSSVNKNLYAMVKR